MFGSFNDPFFGDVRRQMHRQMAEMDSLMDAMMGESLGLGPLGLLDQRRQYSRQQTHPMLEEGPSSRRGRSLESYGERSLSHHHRRDPFEELLGGFGGAGGGGLLGGGMLSHMMGGMERMRERAMHDPDAHVYSHSTLISMGGAGPDGRPQYYQATDEVRKAGEIKETRRSVRDSREGEERMEIGHHIGDRAHYIQKRRGRDGEIRQSQRFHGLRESEAEVFDREFSQRGRERLGGGARGGGGGGGGRNSLPRLEAASPGQRRRSAAEAAGAGRGPLITEVEDDATEAEEAKRRRSDGSGHSTRSSASYYAAPPRRHSQARKTQSGPLIEEVE